MKLVCYLVSLTILALLVALEKVARGLVINNIPCFSQPVSPSQWQELCDQNKWSSCESSLSYILQEEDFP
jgi:hypothetical protein